MEPLWYTVRMLSLVEEPCCRLQVSVIGTDGPLTRHINSTFSPTVTLLVRMTRATLTFDSETQIQQRLSKKGEAGCNAIIDQVFKIKKRCEQSAFRHLLPLSVIDI